MLHRLTYHRKAGEGSITFWAKDWVDAERFCALWLRLTQSEQVEFVTLGRSHFEPRSTYYRSNAAPPGAVLRPPTSADFGF